MPSEETRSYTEPQKRMLKLLRHKARTAGQLERLIPTSSSGVSRIANHLYQLIEWHPRRHRFRVQDEHYSEVLEMCLRWEGLID